MHEATEQDIPKINMLLNDPEIIGAFTCERMDAKKIFDAGGIVIFDDLGGTASIPTGSGEYDSHMFFLSEGRGRNAISAIRESLHIMFEKYGATKITAHVPVFRRAARLMTRWAGFKSLGVSDGEEFFEVRNGN